MALSFAHLSLWDLVKLVNDLRDIDAGRKRYVYDAEKRRYVLREWKRPKVKPALCGAMNRRGGCCRAQVVPGRRRCRLHGGASTGPRTEEGRERIRESNRRRARASSMGSGE